MYVYAYLIFLYFTSNATAWVSKGKFYIGGFVLRNCIRPDTFACCVLTSLLCILVAVMFVRFVFTFTIGTPSVIEMPYVGKKINKINIYIYILENASALGE